MKINLCFFCVKFSLSIIFLFLVVSCAGLPGKTYIIIQEPDRIFEYGKCKFTVSSGDILEITQTKTCRGGFGTCYEVQNILTGEYGYVKKDRMEKRHYIFTEIKGSVASGSGQEERGEIETKGKPPENAKFYTNLGNTYLKQNEYVEAVKKYNKAIQLNDKFVMTYINRGIAYSKIGQNNKACSDWERACELGECNMLNIAKKNRTCP